LLHVRGVIAEAFAHRGRQPVRRWVESVWMRLAGPNCLWDAGDVRDVQAFFDLIEQLDSAGHFDLPRLEAAMEKLYAAPDVRANETLQFMTIHKSKGLEFDTVILPGLHRVPNKTDTPLLIWENVPVEGSESQLVAAPWVPKHKREDIPSAYDYLMGLEQERGANEAARVLYVAATRTERRLHLVGAVRTDAKGEVKAPSNTFLQLLWGTVGGEFLNAAQMQPAQADLANEADFIPKLIRLPHPRTPELLSVPAVTVSDWEYPDADAEQAEPGNLDTSCGTLAHLYMEMIVEEGVGQWPVARLRNLLPAMQRWLMQQGHNDEECRRSAERVAAVLVATLESEAGRWVLQPRAIAASELALATADKSRISTHIIDRTFVENGVRWVVDYKSARLGDEVPKEALARQAERYRLQLERYAKLFAGEGLPVRMGVFFMAYGEMVEL